MKFSATCVVLAAGALSASLALPARAGNELIQAASAAPDLTQLSLDELLSIEVTSVSRRAEPLSQAAGAVFVLTGEEIRRSGVRSIAEALRLVPGLEVARVNAQSYAISARGFLNQSADKMEVLIDGRSAYTPLASTVFWDVLDTYLQDIDRIEVIRGPGATLWGVNAVNGVINIVTRSAADTQGVNAQAWGGNEERYGAAARLGTRVGDSGSVRLYAQGMERDASVRADGSDAFDGLRKTQAGFRSDWRIGNGHTLMVSGNGFIADENSADISSGASKTDHSGGDLTVRWTCCQRDDGRWSLQASYDGYLLDIPTIFREQRKTGALDFQQQWQLTPSQTLVYGVGGRVSRDATGGPPLVIIFSPASRTLYNYNGFAQDQIAFFGGDVTLTAGSKFEYANTSGFEIQPSLRGGWQASESIFTWAAASRAVRTPNRIDQDIAIFCPPGGLSGFCTAGSVVGIGNPELTSEHVLAYEWGLRWRSGQSMSWDLATYFNDYDKLRSTEAGFPEFSDKLAAHGYGVELSSIWQPLETLQLRPSYSYLRFNPYADADSTDTTSVATLSGSNPRHMARLRVAWEPLPRTSVDALVRYMGRLPQTSPSGTLAVPAYTELDLRIAHRWPMGLELALVGNNLLDSRHPEFGGTAARSEFQRSLLLDLQWSWQ